MVQQVNALAADKLQVELAGGRTQQISLRALHGDASGMEVEIRELVGGKIAREEVLRGINR